MSTCITNTTYYLYIFIKSKFSKVYGAHMLHSSTEDLD